MQKCSNCGADLPENSRFCGKCGTVQSAAATDVAASRRNTPQPPSWTPEDGTIATTWSPFINNPAQASAPSWPQNVQGPVTPPPPPFAGNEDEDERRRGIPPWSPQYGAALGGEALLDSGPAYTPGAPFVQGTPQIGSVPSVAGSPNPYINAPVSYPMPGPGNAPSAYPVQGPGNAPISHPVQGPTHGPITHPVQGPTHGPITHPVHGPVHPPHPQPIHQPPEQPGGTQEQPPTHKHHRHHKHPQEQKLHHAAHVTKVAGGSTIKTILIVVVAATVVAAGGIAAATHFLSRPQPLINITSNYKVGNAPAGANGTVLHISGQQFSSNSAITILLDGQVAPGNPGTQSDSNGNFSANMTISSAWSVGTHTLTARDAGNHSTQNSVSVTIVQQGQANTPGPDGAPPDDASFRLNITVQGPYSDIADPFASNPVLIITGHPDPEGGTVCSPDDNGQPITSNSTTLSTGTPYTEVSTATCSGTYKAGQISYSETDTSVSITWQDNGLNINCVQPKSAVDLQMTGAYAGNGAFSGKFNAPEILYTCDQQGYGFHQVALNGTWTGTIITQ